MLADRQIGPHGLLNRFVIGDFAKIGDSDAEIFGGEFSQLQLIDLRIRTGHIGDEQRIEGYQGLLDPLFCAGLDLFGQHKDLGKGLKIPLLQGLADFALGEETAESLTDCCQLQEVVKIHYGRRFGVGHTYLDVGKHEKIKGVVTGTGADIEEKDIGIKRGQATQEPLLLLKGHIGTPQGVAASGNDLQAVKRAESMDNITERLEFSVQKIGQAGFWFEESIENMNIGTSQVQIHNTDSQAGPGQQQSDIGNDHGLPRAAFS